MISLLGLAVLGVAHMRRSTITDLGSEEHIVQGIAMPDPTAQETALLDEALAAMPAGFLGSWARDRAFLDSIRKTVRYQGSFVHIENALAPEVAEMLWQELWNSSSFKLHKDEDVVGIPPHQFEPMNFTVCADTMQWMDEMVTPLSAISCS